MTTNIAIAICSTLLGFCLSLITLSLAAKKKPHRNIQQAAPRLDEKKLKQLEHKLQTALSEEQPMRIKPVASFKQTLDSAALTTEFQIPRLMTQNRVHQPAPEKYTILSKLVSKGLNPDEIASILGISTREANQLTKLCALAEPGK
ncbi:MAG: hypothetical protein CSB34_04215 [Desulfobulbus propionicus]|nr:MAG: hypothetical protein CSB34_04215 [Desulfobulbus propionicus]